MVDCPCGFGKNISENQTSCPICGTDISPLHRIRSLPQTYLGEGRRLADQSDLDRAIEFLTCATALAPNSAQARAALGDAYARKKKYEEALTCYRLAAEIEPESEELKREREKIEAVQSEMIEKDSRRSGRSKALLFILPIVALATGILTGFLLRGPAAEPILKDTARRIEELKNRLSAHPELEKLNLEVTSLEGEIKIAGTVPSELHKLFVAEMAINAQGDNQVDVDQVDVDGLSVASAEIKEPRQSVYTVRSGDTLATIAIRFYGKEQGWSRIYEANRDKIKDPRSLSVGQVLSIPD